MVAAHSLQPAVLGLMGATSLARPQQPVADAPRWPPGLLGTSCVVQCLLQTPSGSGYRQSRTENIRLLFFPHPALLPHPPSPESSPPRRSPSQALFLGRFASDERLLRQSLCQWSSGSVTIHQDSLYLGQGGAGGAGRTMGQHVHCLSSQPKALRQIA